MLINVILLFLFVNIYGFIFNSNFLDLSIYLVVFIKYEEKNEKKKDIE